MEQRRELEYLEAEANLERLHDEVPPFIPVSAGPSNVTPTPTVSLPVFSVPTSNVSIPMTSSTVAPSSDDPSLKEMQVQVSALRKPYPSAPIIVSEGFLGGYYFGCRPTQDRATSTKPAQVLMGKSIAQAAVFAPTIMGEKYENVSKQTRSAPAAILEPQCEP